MLCIMSTDYCILYCLYVHVVIEGLMEDWPCQMGHPLLIKTFTSLHLTLLKLDNNYTKFQLEILIFFLVCAYFFQEYIFVDFTIGMIGNETGHLLNFVKLYRKFININEI